MCTLIQDREGTPARSASRTSLAKVPATCVQDARIGYIRDVQFFETVRIISANGWICTASRTPRAPSPPPNPAHHIRQHLQHTTVKHKWHRQQIDGTKHLPRGAQRKVAAIQEEKLTAISRSHNIQNYTLVRRLGPEGDLLFFIHNSVSFTRKPLSTTSKNDPN